VLHFAPSANVQMQLALSIFELLVDNLPRLNEQEEADKQGIFYVLGSIIPPCMQAFRSLSIIQEFSRTF
jgi:hypothetical protein